MTYLGGKCNRCGYDKCVAALQFHHQDGDKSFGIAKGGRAHVWEELVKELDKCELLCANCHAEEHYGDE